MANLVQKDYLSDVAAFAGSENISSPVHVLIDASKVQANADGLKPLPPLTCISGINEAARPLPRAKVTTAAVTAASTTVIEVDNAAYFADGDVLYLIPPSAQIDLAAVWAASDTLEIVIGGQSYTETAASATLSEIATATATGINADLALSQMVTAIASGNSIWLLSNDYLTPYSIAVTATTAGTGTAVVSGSFTTLQAYQLIGTIAANGVDAINNQITLAAAASIDVGVGVPIGAPSKPLGLIATGLDLTYDALEQGVYTSAPVYADRLPYWDGEIARLLQITLV